MIPFYVIGHLNPDTDAICAAIGHAAFLRATGEVPDAVPARCGEVPQRTAWVLEQARVDTPILINDVRTNVGMISRQDPVFVKTEDTFLTAYQHMQQTGIRCIPVVDESHIVQGVLRYRDLLELLIPLESNGENNRMVNVSLAKLASTLHAKIFSEQKAVELDKEEELLLLIGAGSEHTIELRLKEAQDLGEVGKYMLICSDRPQTQLLAIKYGVRALLVTGRYCMTDEVLEKAKSSDVVVLHTDLDTATASTLIRCSRKVSYVMNTDFITLKPCEPVSQLRKLLSTSEQDVYPICESKNSPLLGIITKSDMIDPPRIRLALVDHNEYSQAVHGVEEADVKEVIDHHRLAGNLVSREPISYLNEPVGSTCTLIARKFIHHDLEPNAGVALCLCAGIISDTLCLTSPTTTQLDRKMLEQLSKIANIQPEIFTKEFFAVGSLLSTGSAEQILNTDRKEFQIASYKVSVSQIEEVGLEQFDSRKEEIYAYMTELVSKHGYHLAVLAVTDISQHDSIMLYAGDLTNLIHLPYRRIEDNLYFAPEVVSRKKQIFPTLCQVLQSNAHA